MFHGGATTTVAGGAVVTATVTAVMSSTSSRPAPPATILLQPNANQGQGGSPKTGAPLSTTTGVNGSPDIEFFTNMTLQAASASSAFAKATVIAYSVGGYVSFSTETNSSALVVMRVPAANYQEALPQVEALGALVNLRSSSNDVTVQYTDLNATLLSLQAEQASLLKILTQSTNINSTLNVESRIQNVDQQINAVQSEILQTKTLISYATISAFIEERAPTQPTQPLTMKLTGTPRSGDAPLSVTFIAVTKGGTQPYIVNYNFGDGTSYEGRALIHTFQQAGHYNVTVTATDASANVTEASTIVDVLPPPATTTVGGFPNFVGGLFLSVVEGIAEVAVVVVPIVTVLLLVLFPLRYRLGLSSRKASHGAESAGASR
jgi:PKD repeat protein